MQKLKALFRQHGFVQLLMLTALSIPCGISGAVLFAYYPLVAVGTLFGLMMLMIFVLLGALGLVAQVMSAVKSLTGAVEGLLGVSKVVVNNAIINEFADTPPATATKQ